MDSHIIDELTAICNRLGSIDINDGTYMRDRDCKPCLKEILRFLGSDTERHTARLHLGELNVVKSDLIPIFVQYCDFNEGDPELFNIILRLTTNLTSPVALLFENQEVPSEPDLLKTHNKLLECLLGYKQAFASDERIWSTLNVHLRHNEEEEVTFERLIILIRNILHIPVDARFYMGHLVDFDTHDMCLYRMEKSGMLSTLIEIASGTQKGTEYAFHIMEVIYLMLRNQNPMTIAQAKRNLYRGKLGERDLDKKRLQELTAREKRVREVQSKEYLLPRFASSGAGGPLYVAQNYRGIGSPMLVSRPIKSVYEVSFSGGKTELRKAKNKKPLSSESSMLISDRNTKSTKIAYELKIFCTRFIENVYNNYMQQIKHNLIQKKAQEYDETYYLWAIHFFSSYNRHLGLSLDNIAETLSTSTLHFIQILINSLQEKLKMEKKKYKDISERLHLALRAYREVLQIIRAVSPDSPYLQTVQAIKKNVFNELEYSTLIINLLQDYDEPKHTNHYLEDLIHTNDIFIEILDGYSKSIGQENNIALFITRYCRPEILKAYNLVLKRFKTNEDSTNLRILKFFERISNDCQCKILLEQASIFKCLLEIVDYDSSMPGYQGYVDLFKDLIRDFGAKCNKRRWVFQEFLFWKDGPDRLEIENSIDPPPPVDLDVPTQANEPASPDLFSTA